ncbi:MAG: hypothetical protein MUO26_08210 [Methanotrichaceae archaeon]|nr:hypothetical protein [Methanotrichaceae archaeon]
MKLRLIVTLIVLASLALISVENAWAQNLPPLQSLVWTTRASYNVGETVPILYLVTKPAFVTITVAGPGGTTNFNNGARGSTVLTFNGKAGQPTGWRTVTMRATANDNPWEVITVRTSFNVGQSPPTWGSPPPTFSAPA